VASVLERISGIITELLVKRFQKSLQASEAFEALPKENLFRMIVESVLTAYLKRKYSKILQFSNLGNIDPPRPQPGKEYLLYVHIPFCEELCPYCSFNRFVLERDLAREYFKALAVRSKCTRPWDLISLLFMSGEAPRPYFHRR